jgi:hypothetical protein
MGVGGSNGAEAAAKAEKDGEVPRALRVRDRVDPVHGGEDPVETLSDLALGLEDPQDERIRTASFPAVAPVHVSFLPVVGHPGRSQSPDPMAARSGAWADPGPEKDSTV